MKKSKKLTIIFSIIVAIATIGFVRKEFQNDTFFNISIGKYILENGIDMHTSHPTWRPETDARINFYPQPKSRSKPAITDAGSSKVPAPGKSLR